jgi:hypothetical protein
MEFEYTRPPIRGRAGVPGGRMEFQRLPDGRWITSSWVIRMPVEAQRMEMNRLAPATRQVIAVREVGGTVVPPATATLAAATPPAAPVPGTLPPLADVVVNRDGVPVAPPAAASDVPTAEEVVSTVIAAGPEAQRQTERRRFLGRLEIERTPLTTAFELVQSLRPQWMRARGSDALTMTPIATRDGIAMAITDESPIMVYVDGRRLGTLDALRSIPHGEIDYIEFYDAAEAVQRFGSGNPQGVIHVVRRGARSRN